MPNGLTRLQNDSEGANASGSFDRLARGTLDSWWREANSGGADDASVAAAQIHAADATAAASDVCCFFTCPPGVGCHGCSGTAGEQNCLCHLLVQAASQELTLSLRPPERVWVLARVEREVLLLYDAEVTLA